MNKAMQVPDLDSMTGEQLQMWMLSLSQEELADWFMNHDLSVVLRKLPSEPSTGPFELVGPVPANDNLRRAAFRIEPETLDWLSAVAGRDREGKSGIVRRALAEFRERHPELGSEAA